MLERTLTDIPTEEKADELVQSALNSGATRAEKRQQPNGLWTVFAVFPEPGAGAADPPQREAVAAAAPAAAAQPPFPNGGRTVEPGLSLGASARATVAEGVVLPRPAVVARAAAIDTLARTIWGEARGEPRDGKEAVAAVILNRLKRGPARRFGDTVEACCRMPRHFSCWNEGDPNRAKLLAVTEDDPAFRECIEIATLAIDGQLHDRTDGCDHYHTTRVHPLWSRGKEPKVAIGNHLFFDDIA